MKFCKNSFVLGAMIFLLYSHFSTKASVVKMASVDSRIVKTVEQLQIQLNQQCR